MWRFVSIALAVAPGALLAQEATRAAPDSGAYVRYRTPPSKPWRSGRVISRSGSMMQVRLGLGAQDEVVSLDSIQDLQIGTPRSSAEGARRGALVGLATGASVSLILAIVILSGEPCPDGCLMPDEVVVAALGAGTLFVFTAAGAAIGTASPGVVWPAVPRRAERQLRFGLRLPTPNVH